MKGTSTPGLPRTNAVAERTVRRVAEGVRTLLLQAGLPPCCWPWAMEYFSTAWNTHERGGSSPWFDRHQQHFRGKKVPFGCLVDYLPSPDEVKQMQSFGTKAVPAIFLGWKLNAGCAWNGEYYFARLEDFVSCSLASNTRSLGVHVRTSRSFDWDGKLVFPLRERFDATNRTLEGLSGYKPTKAWAPLAPPSDVSVPPDKTHPGYDADEP